MPRQGVEGNAKKPALCLRVHLDTGHSVHRRDGPSPSTQKPRNRSMLECPDPKLVERYASGLLLEKEAESLSSHLEICANCQSRVDEFARTEDSVVGSLRHGAPPDSAATPELERLIIDAQRLDPGTHEPPPTAAQRGRSLTPPVDVRTFLRCLRRSALLDTEELDAVERAAEGRESATIASELVAANRLTRFQAGVLLRGRWKGLILGNYVLLDRLGHGGMGQVFKARHRRMGREVCLKVLYTTGTTSPEVVERFRREGRAVASLDHPNIVVAYDADEENGTHFLVMELVEGKDLAKVVADDGPLSAKTAAAICLQAATALEYAHQQGIVHRDVKPHNLLLDREGEIKVLDLGLARLDAYLGKNPDALTHASMTTTNSIMGTVDYMSPEQALNSRLADQQSDIYSLGCTLYYVLTGRVMYSGETVMEKLLAHRERNVPALRNSRIPATLEAVFTKMVAKDPARRYQSMAQVAGDLELFLAGKRPAALVARRRRRAAETVRRGVLWGAPVFLVGLALALVGWFGPLGKAPPGADGDGEAERIAEGVVPEDAGTKDSEEPPPAVAAVAKPSPDPQPDEDVPALLAVGGPGRVLVIVAHQSYSASDHAAVLGAAWSRGVEVVTASSAGGVARPRSVKSGTASVLVDLTLVEVRADEFDVLIFCGGELDEFTNRSIHADECKRIIREGLGAGRAIVGFSEGREVLKYAEVYKKLQLRTEKGLELGRPEGSPGWVLFCREPKYCEALFRVLFEDLLR